MITATDSGLKKQFELVVGRMARFLSAERLLVLFGREGELLAQAAQGLPTDLSAESLPISLEVVRRVRDSARPVLSANLQEDAEFEATSSLVLSEVRSVLCVPLRGPDARVHGVLYADHRQRSVAFNHTHLVRLQQLARELEGQLWPGHVSQAELARRQRPPVKPLVRKPIPQVKHPDLVAGPLVPLAARSRVVMLRSLATMVGASLSFSRSLDVLTKGGDDPALREVCSRIRDHVDHGHSLSACVHATMQGSRFLCAMLQVAENTGSMVEVLSLLADHTERTHATWMRLRAALTYPLVLTLFCCLGLLLLPPLVLRGQQAALAQSGVPVPWLTRALFGLSGWLLSPLGLLLVALGLVALVRFARSPRAWPLWLRLPRLGRLVRQATQARFASTLALELKVGVPLNLALPLAVQTTGDPVLQDRLGRAQTALDDGATLTGALEATGYFQPAFLQLMAAGEQAGKLPQTLQWTARLIELDLEAALEMTVAALEPILMLLMGIAAGLVALATLLPTLRLLESL